jgi:hypothetical protein
MATRTISGAAVMLVAIGRSSSIEGSGTTIITMIPKGSYTPLDGVFR